MNKGNTAVASRAGIFRSRHWRSAWIGETAFGQDTGCVEVKVIPFKASEITRASQ